MTPFRITVQVGRYTLTLGLDSKPAEHTTLTARATSARQRRRVVGFTAPQEDPQP